MNNVIHTVGANGNLPSNVNLHTHLPRYLLLIALWGGLPEGLGGKKQWFYGLLLLRTGQPRMK